jgi:hypothetical protein
MKTEEEIIRDLSDYALKQLIEKGAHDYSIDAISVAKDELKKRETNLGDYNDSPPTDMYNYFGTGTMLYGKRDIHPDGSYIATKWLTICFFPIGAIDSYRVKVLDMSLGNISYEMKKVDKNWRQILNTVLITWVPTILFFVLLNIKSSS